MAIPITAADTVTRSALTDRPILETTAFVHRTGISAASFPADLTAAALSVGTIPAESAPLLGHGIISYIGIST
jgi:hypothetical protein